VSSRVALAAATVLAVAGLAVPAAGATPLMIVGFNDEANTLYGDADWSLPLMQQLHTQLLRVDLYWGGPYAVAKRKPAHPADPADPAYDWRLYDRLVRKASNYGIQVMFSIVFTPPWANGGRARNVAPTTTAGWNALRGFALAAATRYSGVYVPPVSQQDPTDSTSALPLPWVHYWTAWNEPNNPVFLFPQWRKVGKKYRIESARNYAKICNAIYSGVHSALVGGEKVACGVTAPRGNDEPTSKRPSVDPMAFMRAAKAAGLKTFDAYAHHPYYGFPNETPSYKPNPTKTHAIQLGNIDVLIAQMTKLWGRKPLWITEYGYQTKPQDRLFGVTYAQQAAYLRQAYLIARKNPRIGMMLWFLLKDDARPSGWQSGLITNRGVKKPAFAAFEKVAALFIHR
jgi:hypothetical protein